MDFDTEEDWDRFALNPVINGEQMRTLVDPEEHWEHMTHSIDLAGYNYSKEEMRSSKEEEARTTGSASYVHGAGIYDWMARGDRQRKPIEVMVNPGEEGYGQGEGHHRAAAKAALQADTGEQHLVKFTASRGFVGHSAGTRYSEDYESEYEPTPTPSSQRETERKMTPSNQPKLAARTSRNESFTWNKPRASVIAGIDRAVAERDRR